MRNRKNTILAFTLTEMLVTMAIMVIVMAAAVPTVQKLREAMEQSTGVKSIIDAAMANARAIAIREQKYAGVRFQMDVHGNTYLILIINDYAGTGFANGFRAVEGRKPIMLPEKFGVIADADYYSNLYIQNKAGMNEATTFSILFGPSGQFVVHDVRVYSDDGKANSDDRIFNNESNVALGLALFRRDGSGSDADAAAGYRQEESVQKIMVYDKKELDKFKTVPWEGYLKNIKDKNLDQINPYTGELIRKE